MHRHKQNQPCTATVVVDKSAHLRAAVLEAWRGKVASPWLDVRGTLQFLDSDHVRKRDQALLRGVLGGGVWNGFLLVKVEGQHVPCRFCGAADGDGHLFLALYFSSSG